MMTKEQMEKEVRHLWWAIVLLGILLVMSLIANIWIHNQMYQMIETVARLRLDGI